MIIPRRKLEGFVNDIANQCFSTRQDRQNRGAFFENYFATGSADTSTASLFNKVFASIDDLESLLFSPVSLRFHIGDPDAPNVLNEAKGRAAAAKLRAYARKSDTDSAISAAVRVSLVKGKGIVKQLYKRGQFNPVVVQPENFGVLREDHAQLDEDMEAFAESMWITPYQFERLIANHPDRADLLKKSRRYRREATGGLDSTGGAMSVVVGGLYPFQPAGMAPTGMRGIVDWMGQPKPFVSPEVMQSLLELKEVWIWDDRREDWATFQIIGDDMLITGKYQIVNAMALDPRTQRSVECLKGDHPYREFCVNPVDNYFWGKSEIAHLIGLQEAINARIIGINRMLRKQEEPSTKFVGSTGVNQTALSRYRKPGGYFTDANPNAKIEDSVTTIPQDIWASLHEYERMFDDLMGLPPIARGKGDAGVRSHAHAETLVRQFSPRFKDRALLVERSVESVGGLMLDQARAGDARKLTAWVDKENAGLEAAENDPLMVPPAKGLAPVRFTFADLPEEVTLTVDSHSSSPAFSQDAKTTNFDLLKIGGMSKADVVERSDVTDPEDLVMGIVRREIAAAEAKKAEDAAKAAHERSRKH